MRDWFKSQKGQTLVELLVAIAISAILLPALATALAASREGRAQEPERLRATALLREANEAVRVEREKGWTQFAVNGTYHPVILVNTWNLDPGAETISGFTRQVVISSVQRNSSGQIVASGGTVDLSTKQVVATVSWTQPLATTITTTAYYSRYQNNALWTQTTQSDFDGGTKTNTASNGGQLELAAGAGAATPTHKQSAGTFGDATATTIAQALPSRVTGGSLIVVTVTWDTAATTAVTCSDSQGNTYVTAVNTNDTTNVQALAVCYAANAAGGTTTVTATFGASSVTRRIIVSEYSGVATTSPVDITRSNVANGTTATNNITSTAGTTTTNGDLIFGAVMDTTGTTTITAGTGFTLRSTIGSHMSVEDQVQATAGSIAATFTFNAVQRYIAHMIAFKPLGTPVAWAPPNITSSADTAGTENALDVYVSGNYAYVADATILRIYDITTITNPTALGTFTAAGNINSLVVSGNYVFLATAGNSAEFTVVNATNKSSLTGTAYDPAGTNDGLAIFVANNHAYLGRALSGTAGQFELVLYDVTNPASPILRGGLNLSAQVNSVYVPTATHAYLGTSVTTAELTVAKIDVPTTPTSAGTYDASGLSVASDVFAVGDTVYLAKTNNTSGAELFILTANTTVPTAVTFTLNGSGYEMGGNINGVSVVGSTAFLATAVTNNQFRALNVSVPATPTVIGSLNLAAVGNDIFSDANYSYVATAHDTRELTIVQPTPAVSGGGGYQASGTFESSSFDCVALAVCTAGGNAAFNYITFNITEPASTNIQFQLAANNDNTTWNYVGPDGTSGTFYTTAAGIPVSFPNGRYFRYRATLTGPGTSTPSLQDISINYSP